MWVSNRHSRSKAWINVRSVLFINKLKRPRPQVQAANENNDTLYVDTPLRTGCQLMWTDCDKYCKSVF